MICLARGDYSINKIEESIPQLKLLAAKNNQQLSGPPKAFEGAGANEKTGTLMTS